MENSLAILFFSSVIFTFSSINAMGNKTSKVVFVESSNDDTNTRNFQEKFEKIKNNFLKKWEYALISLK